MARLTVNYSRLLSGVASSERDDNIRNFHSIITDHINNNIFVGMTTNIDINCKVIVIPSDERIDYRLNVSITIFINGAKAADMSQKKNELLQKLIEFSNIIT